MSAIFSAHAHPRMITLARAIAHLPGAIARYFSHRAAIARLREFDKGALRDIGLARSEIEAAVHGRITGVSRVRVG